MDPTPVSAAQRWTGRAGILGGWLAWSPVSAAFCGLLGASLLIGGVKGCGLESPLAPSDPMAPFIPPGPAPPLPPPTPDPMNGRADHAADDLPPGQWRPFPRGSTFHGCEAFCLDINGVPLMKKIRLIDPSRGLTLPADPYRGNER